MGRGVGFNIWIVEPTDYRKLAAIGTIGEALIEGPLVGSGYHSDMAKTTALFVEDPPWLMKGASGHGGRVGRLYKTEDLMRYSDDGTLIFVGRKRCTG